MNTLPSSAYAARPPMRQATVVSRPVAGGDRRVARCSAARSSRCRRCSWRCRPRSTPGRRAPPAGLRRSRRPARQPAASTRSLGARRLASRTESTTPLRLHLAQGIGTPGASISSSHATVRRLSRQSVREALVESVTWTRPPVSFHTSQLSTVPKAQLAALGAPPAPTARGRAASAILVPEKYASSTSPVRSRTIAARRRRPSARRTCAAVRRHCQTIARCDRACRSRAPRRCVVSRWLVMPDGGDLAAAIPRASASALAARLPMVAQISSGRARPSRAADSAACSSGVAARPHAALRIDHERGGAGRPLIEAPGRSGARSPAEQLARPGPGGR